MTRKWKDAPDETHPSFALASFSRVHGMPGASLFDSEIRHLSFVTLRITRASRRRQLNHDWIHPEGELIEVAMSHAQFGALVSSFGQGSGVPVTLHRIQGKPIDPPTYAPRTAESLKEVGSATAGLVKDMREEVAAIRTAFDAKAGRKQMGDAIRDLELRVEQAAGNAVFVAKAFTEHVENVVTKARGDVEAMVELAASRGLPIGDEVKKLLPGNEKEAKM